MNSQYLRVRIAIVIGRLIAHATDKCALAESARSIATQPFQPATVVSGSAHERGLAYGKRFKNGIREFFDREIYTAYLDKPFTKREMLKYAAECGAVTREVCPMLAAECDGMADGAGVTFEEVIVINLHEELRHLARP